MSGPEKSRHLRHESRDDPAGAEGELHGEDTLGFVAMSLERSGRDAKGTGGGIAVFAAPVPNPWTSAVVERSGLVGIGGISLGGSFLSGSLDRSLAAGL